MFGVAGRHGAPYDPGMGMIVAAGMGRGRFTIRQPWPAPMSTILPNLILPGPNDAVLASAVLAFKALPGSPSAGHCSKQHQQRYSLGQKFDMNEKNVGH